MVNEKKAIFQDRVDIRTIWFKDAFKCSESFGTPLYPIMVARFENDMINIKDGPRFKDIINKYKHTQLKEYEEKIIEDWINNHPQESQNRSYLRDLKVEVNVLKAKNLCNFMLQLIDEKGYGFWKKESDTIEEKMD